jgi:3-hydroxyethyl bacteriochlorophyllide a dehydrogenase
MDDDVVVDVEWSGISTGTESCCGPAACRPSRHGLSAGAGLRIGRPRAPGRSRVGPPGRRARVRARRALLRRGARPVRRRGVAAGGAGRRRRCRRATNSASAACCWRWPPRPTTRSPAAPREPIVPPDLIVGHGVLGRLLARLTVLAGRRPRRCGNQSPSAATAPPATAVMRPRRRRAPRLPLHLRRQRRRVASSTPPDRRLAPGGEIVLAGFYRPSRCVHVPAGVHARGADPRRRRMEAADLLAVRELAEIRAPVARRPDHPSHAGADAERAYRTAFGDPPA